MFVRKLIGSTSSINHAKKQMSSANTLEELHRFFEDNPDDYQLETEADVRLKSLYSCLVNATSRTMLQIGLTGLLTYVKASRSSATIDELLLSKDYISEIITIAADHFNTAPLLSATCLYECMLTYPKKFSPFLINKFRPLLPRIIYKKSSGPSEISCKCIAHLSVLGIPSSSKQAKSWKNEYDRYLKIASLLTDQLYSGLNDPLCPEITDIETSLFAEIGDTISSTDYGAIFCNCCHILRYLFYVQLDSSVNVPCEQTFQLISKVLSLNAQQFNILHRKQHLPTLLVSCVQLCDTLITFNPSSFMFNIRSIFTLFISLLDLVRPQVEYLTLVTTIYEFLTNAFVLFHRQVRMDVDILQKFIRWIINDTTIRPRSKGPSAYLSKPNANLSRVALKCTQQLLNVYADHLPKDQYHLLQNHFIQTLLACQTTHSSINKPYDDERCRVDLYEILECLLINERADCSTILAVSKDLIDHASSFDSSLNVKMTVRKLKLIWQQVQDSSSHLYQPWSFLNIGKPRKIIPSMASNELHNVFVPLSMPMISTAQSLSSVIHTDTPPPPLVHPQPLSKPSVYQTPTETNVFLQPSMPFSSPEVLPVVQPSNLEGFAEPMIEENIPAIEQQRKRPKLVDTRPVEIDDDDDDNDEDRAEQIFADEDGQENDSMDEYDEEISEEMDESEDDEDDESDISSEGDEGQLRHTNGVKKINQHSDLHPSNINPLGSPSDSYLQSMNDNLHKKFRRQNHFEQQYSPLQPLAADLASINNNNNPIYHSAQLNGDNGQSLIKPIVSNGQSPPPPAEDDDDIVLVSDDDSAEEKSPTDIDLPPPSNAYVETVTVKTTTTTTTLVVNDAVSAKDFLEKIDRPSWDHVNRLETSSIDKSTTSISSAVRETIEALCDAINLVSDDSPIPTTKEQH